MPTFTIYADWRPVVEATDDLLGAVADALLPTSPGRCVWVDDRKPGVVQLSFDVMADGYEHAVDEGRHLLTEVVPGSGLPGTLAEVTALDDHGQFVWTNE